MWAYYPKISSKYQLRWLIYSRKRGFRSFFGHPVYENISFFRDILNFVTEERLHYNSLKLPSRSERKQTLESPKDEFISV